MEQIFNTLTQLIKNHDKIMIMTHKHPDFDGMGCAIALQQIIKSFNKESFICTNKKETNKALLKAYQYMEDKELYYQTMTNEEGISFVDENTLLIIVDVFKEGILEEPKLLSKTKQVVVIDHHIKGPDYIKDTILTYINSNLSCTVEFVANYIKYLNKTIHPVIATFMQVGIEIDTNSFKLKTTDKTFETSAYLSRMGADIVIKQELLQESKDEYIKKQKLIEKSFMINDNMAMCIADDEIYEKEVLASIAEELLQFENVQASFALGKISSHTIGVSARSLGTIDVETIMSQLGGGGHLNEAAAQIENKTMIEIKQAISEIIGG